MTEVAWAALKGLPKTMMWLVKVIGKKEGKFTVFCNSDNAVLTVSETFPFPGENFEALKERGAMKSYKRGHHFLKTICSECSLSTPKQIESVSLRKYTATLLQMFDLNKYQLDWICKYLGHTKMVHQEHYQQISGMLERVYVSKLLPIQDFGLTGKYKGQNLEDIDIREIVIPSDGNSTASIQTTEEELINCSDENDENDDIYISDELDSQQSEVDSLDERPAAKRQMTKVEEDELKKYFSEYLRCGITPRGPACNKARQRSKANRQN